MSPENQWLEDVFPIEIVPFLGDMLVFGVYISQIPNDHYYFLVSIREISGDVRYDWKTFFPFNPFTKLNYYKILTDPNP